MIEEIKSVGSIVGLITGFVYFYDRFARGRPIASLTIAQDGSRPSPRIRIGNVSSYDIAVLDITVWPEVYGLSEDNTVRGTVKAAAGLSPYFMLKPSADKELWIMPKFDNNVAREIRPQRVTFFIWWRRGNATWLPQLPVPVFTDTVTIRKYGLEKSGEIG